MEVSIGISTIEIVKYLSISIYVKLLQRLILAQTCKR